MTDAFSDLKAACSGQQPKSASDLIRAGSTSWFAGRPTSAPPGTIALSQNGPFKVIVREEDVKSVEKHEGLYLVEVSADANILIGLEKVIKAKLSGCGCHPKPPVPTVMLTTVDPKADVNILYIDVDGTPNECAIRVECQTIAGRRVCFIVGVACGLG